MIRVDGPPEAGWAAAIARLMVERGRTTAQLARFFRAVFAPVNTQVHPRKSGE